MAVVRTALMSSRSATCELFHVGQDLVVPADALLVRAEGLIALLRAPFVETVACLTGRSCGRKNLENADVVVDSQADLLQIFAALETPPRLAGCLDGRQQEGD